MDLPQEFISKMQKLLGEEAEEFFQSLDTPEQKGITANFCRLPKDIFLNNCDFEISPIEHIDNGFYVDSFRFGQNILNHLGVIYSQEPSAMYPVEMLDIEHNDRVLDICASPGGKSIQILEKLENTGILISNEINFARNKILYENLSRMGFYNYIITCNSPDDFEDSHILFDKIIVDAPCGGEGMLRKSNFDPNTFSSINIETNSRRQLNILNSIKNNLKVGGKLVYSTCTYDIRENEDVIAEFLRENPNFQILPYPKLKDVMQEGISLPDTNTHLAYRRYPHKCKGEGQFMILLTKTSGDNECISPKAKHTQFESLGRKDLDLIKTTLKDIIDITKFNFAKRNDTVYILPHETLATNKLNVTHIGCILGTISKGILKLHHNFYHTFGNQFEHKLGLDANQVKKYLQGDELDIDAPNGIYAVTYLQVALGGGKIINNRLKNYYDKNLRL